MAFAPIFIIGVPRSGTTLLRVLLDSHSQILALPETPWVLGAYGGRISLRELVLELSDGAFGVARNVAGVDPAHVRAAGAAFLEQLVAPALAARVKTAVVFKTPSDIPHLEFLTGLLPQARYIHITRDGRDVALSQLAKKGSFFNDLRGYRRLSYANVFRRWMEWEQRVQAVLYRGDLNVVHLNYEDLIADPGRELRRVMAFLQLPFEPGMLDYAAKAHDYPAWEAGSTDVARRGGVSSDSVGKWRAIKPSIEMIDTWQRHDRFLVELGYQSSALSPTWRQRGLVAGFAFARPAIEAVAIIARRLRPLLRDGRRLFACALLLLLALQFLGPANLLNPLGLASDRLGPLLCFVAAFGFAAAFMAPLQRRSGFGFGPGLLKAGEILLAYIAALEGAQLFIPGHHAALGDFLLNALGIIAALIAAIPLSLRVQARAPSA